MRALCGIVLLAAASGALAEVVDFREAKCFVHPPGAVWHVSSDGTSAWNDPVVGFSAFTVAADRTDGKPFELSFDIRGFELADPGHHWGLRMTSAAGDELFTWSQGDNGLIFQLRNRKRTMLEDGSGGEKLAVRGKPGDDIPWTTVRLTCDGEGLQARMGRHICYRAETPMLGISNIWFYAYNESVEFRNIRIEALRPPKVDAAEKPTFHTDGGPAGSWAVTNAVSSAVGGLSCWMRPMERTDHLVFSAADGKEVAAFSLYQWDMARARVAQETPGVQPVTFMRRVNSLVRRTDEWYHFAFTWNEKGRGRLYVNGLPYCPTGESSADLSLTGNALGRTARVSILENAVRDLTLWRRPLTAREIVDDYRRRIPVDCVIVDSLLPAGDVAFPPRFRIAPAGFYARPHPIEDDVLKRVDVSVATRLERIVERRTDPNDPTRVTGYRFDPVPGAVTPPRELSLTGPVELAGAAVPLESGEYRLAVSVKPRGAADKPAVRHLLFTVAPKLDTSAVPRTKDDLKRGRLLWEKTLGSPYREAGTNQEYRFFAEVPFPADVLEKPCLLEVEWPDDKPRAMGLYMYERVDSSCREHLQQGIVAGGELPSSGQLQTARYLFYPATSNYLFEARTFIANRPAAVRALRVFAIDGPLPALAVHRPEGLPGRTFGHCDEDQTFDNNLTSARLDRPTTEVLARLAEYMNYTGQNAFHFSALRYGNMNYGFVEGVDNGGGPFPRRIGEWRGMVRGLARCGIATVPQNMFSNDPTIVRLGQIEGRDRTAGRMLADNDGVLRRFVTAGRAPMNHLNEDEVSRFFSQFTDFFQDLSVQGVDRTLFCLGNDIASPLAWRSWDYGSTNEPGWRAKRCAPVTRNARRYVKAMTAANKSLRVTVEIPADRAMQDMRGVDVEALAKIPNLDFAVIRFPTDPWWPAYRGEDKTPVAGLEKWYGAQARADLARLRRASGGSLPVVYSYPTYYESFAKLPEEYRKKYGNMFQNADVKPWGRHFLRELAFCLAETDMLHYAIGMQPLAAWGAEDVVREFTQAYCALPALPFEDVSVGDVVVRKCKTKNGTYWYFLNTTDRPQTVTAPATGLLDLSTDTPLADKAVSLAPYQLRAFLLP